MNAIAERPAENGARHKPHEQLPSIAPPRLPYHPAIQERFGIDKASWKALVEAIFPLATSTESVILALSYCRARKLDPFKRNVHIVPIWNKDLRRYIDTIWPGIGELRTTAFRTGEYAGRDRAEYGELITRTFTGTVGKDKRPVEITVTYPEWCQVTVYRSVKGQRVAFAGAQVYWTETYATLGHDSDVPNDMWATRPRGQLEKCAEAAALRAAFPEEVGGDYIPEEVQHRVSAGTTTIESTATETLDHLAEKLISSGGEIPLDTPDEPDAGERPQNDLSHASQSTTALLEEATAAFQVCELVTEVEKCEREFCERCPSPEDAEAVRALGEQRREAIKGGRGERSNKR